jgi:hypothetical protein
MNWKEEGDAAIITDNYRQEQMQWLNDNGDSLRI